MCDICSSDICSPLFWDSCSPYFGTFAPPISGHLLIGHLLIGHLLPPFLGHLLPVTILQQSQGKSESEYEKNVFGVLTFRRKITLWTLTTYSIRGLQKKIVPFSRVLTLRPPTPPGLGKPHRKNIAVHLGIAQIALDPPPAVKRALCGTYCPFVHGHFS